MTFSRLKNMTTKGTLAIYDQVEEMRDSKAGMMDRWAGTPVRESQRAAWACQKDGCTSAIGDIQSNSIAAALEDEVFSKNRKG